MSGWVTVTGLPCSISRLNRGITDPLEPSTLPNRVVTNSVTPSFSWDRYWMIISQHRLEAPITLVGFTALSVEIITNFCTLWNCARLATLKVPTTLFLIASIGEASIRGTCL